MTTEQEIQDLKRHLFLLEKHKAAYEASSEAKPEYVADLADQIHAVQCELKALIQ